MSGKEYCSSVDISSFVPEHDNWTPRSVLEKLNLSLARQNVRIETCDGLDSPDLSRYKNRWYCFVTVSVEGNGKSDGLVTSAQRMFDCFGKHAVRAQLQGDMNFPLNVGMILHEADKRNRRATWRGGEDYHYIEPDGPDHFRIYFSVLIHAFTTNSMEAERLCSQDADALALAVDATYHTDLPVQAAGDKPDDWWAAYEFAVRVAKKDEFSMIEESALRLYKSIEGKPIYVELDDSHSTSLSMLVRYFIPKRRGTLNRGTSTQ